MLLEPLVFAPCFQRCCKTNYLSNTLFGNIATNCFLTCLEQMLLTSEWFKHYFYKVARTICFSDMFFCKFCKHRRCPQHVARKGCNTMGLQHVENEWCTKLWFYSLYENDVDGTIGFTVFPKMLLLETSLWATLCLKNVAKQSWFYNISRTYVVKQFALATYSR